jgi:YidC/Oxa1 family membrane protein insertase
VLQILQPIVEVLRGGLTFFTAATHDYALAIVLLTLVIKMILHPLTRIQLRSVKAMQVLAPHMAALKLKYKDEPKVLNQELMALYRAHNVNPMMGCLPLVVQMPILYALFRLLGQLSSCALPAVSRAAGYNPAIVGFPWMRIDAAPKLTDVLGVIPQHPEAIVLFVFPLLVGVTTWLQSRMTVTDPQQARLFLFMPVMVGYFATLYPLGLSLYWIVSTLASMGEVLLVIGRPRAPVMSPPKSQQASKAKMADANRGPVPTSRTKRGGKRV